MSFLKANFFTILLLLLVIFSVSASLYRFYILKDYDVTYEVECDPYVNKCFVSCIDDSCDEVFYYKYVTKHASDLYDLCGPDITDCEAAASACVDGQVACEITFCTDDMERCDDLDISDQDLELDGVIEYNNDL